MRGTNLQLGVSKSGTRITVALSYKEVKPTDLHINGAYSSTTALPRRHSTVFRLGRDVRVAPESEWLPCVNPDYAVVRLPIIPFAAPAHTSEPRVWN